MERIAACTWALVHIFFCVACSKQETESIVLVNIRNLDREQIANELLEISKYHPKVIAIDAIFRGKPSTPQDTALVKAVVKCKNLVVPSFIANFTGVDTAYAGFEQASDFEYVGFAKTGFTNTRFEDEEYGILNLADSATALYQNNLKFFALRRTSLYEKVGGKTEYHFSIRTAMEYDSLQTISFIENNPRIIKIDYKNGKRSFPILNADDILGHKITSKDVEQKIILMGDIGQTDYDMVFTPMNKRSQNPPEPDMYGVVFLANVISQILEFRK